MMYDNANNMTQWPVKLINTVIETHHSIECVYPSPCPSVYTCLTLYQTTKL